MQSSKYLENSRQDTWQFNYNMKHHKARLKTIKKEKSKQSLSPLRKKSRGRVRDRNSEISKENEVILDRLIKITQKKPQNFLLKNVVEVPRSLNVQVRKHEAWRIAEENRRQADRLASQTSSIKVKSLEKEFQQTRLYKKIRSKSNLFQPKSHFKLPPIKNKLPTDSIFLKLGKSYQKETHKKNPYLEDYYNYQKFTKQYFQSLTHRPLEYSTNFKLLSISPSPDVGMDFPAEQTTMPEVIEEEAT